MCGVHVGEGQLGLIGVLGDWQIGLSWKGNPCYHHRYIQAGHSSGMEHTLSCRGHQRRPGI